MDVLTKSQRSFNMSMIKSKNTRPEVLLKKFLKDLKIPFKENYKKLNGKPDIYIPALNLAIMINGCFWHGHNKCKYFILPKTNAEFWNTKICINKIRDRRNNRLLKSSNVNVLTIWECELKNGKFLEKLLEILLPYSN